MLVFMLQWPIFFNFTIFKSYFVIALDRSRKVKAMTRLKDQLVKVDSDIAYPLTHIGYISELMVQANVPIPEE